MKLISLIINFILLVSVVNSTYLWPLPQDVEFGTETLWIATPSTFQLTQSGNFSELLQTAFNRYQSLIFYGGNTSGSYLEGLDSTQIITDLVIELKSNNENLQIGIDESYTLTVEAPTSTIIAQNPFAALFGLEAFSQLIQYNPSTSSYFIENTTITITDSPRFQHRGLLIDSARHFLPLSVVYRTIDALAYNKMNVLHWHLTDAESFPVECLSYPKLTNGAWNQNSIYTQDQLSQVVQYGLERGVRVLAEFDTPGHSNSWGVGYEITTQCPQWSHNVDNVNLDLSQELTIPIVKAFMTEMSKLFIDNYIHIGGDEVVYQCWEENSNITEFMNKHHISSYNDLMQYYEDKLWGIMSTNNKNMIGWQELFDAYSLDLPEDIVIEVWEDEDTLLSVAEGGYQGILAYGWYLDHQQETWQDFYTFEPFQSNQWTTQLEEYIIGGESCCWGEFVSYANMDQTVWPRTSAVAERLWSPKELNNTVTATPRLADHICRMNRRGILSGPIHPGTC